MGKAWFGHYRLDRLLGSGGTGQVWLARDTVADRAVALKVLACSHAADPTCRLRFTREARLAAQAPGPHRVPIHTFGELDGRLYIDMEFIEGTDVSALLRDSGPLDPARAVAIVAQTAMALDAMHRVGLVHRDVKPSNIMVGPTGFVHLIDFGIAHRIDQPAITANGNVVGTLAYMAPERFDGVADARADQYALACVLYECLTGQRPFGNVDSPQQLRAHLLTAPPSAATLNPAVPAALDAVIARAMAKDPSQRYSSAGEFAATAYTAVTGREAPTVEVAAETEPTNYGALEPLRPAESLGVGAGGFAAETAGGPIRISAAEPMQIADSAAAPMWALESAGEQMRDVGSARATLRESPSTGPGVQGAGSVPGEKWGAGSGNGPVRLGGTVGAAMQVGAVAGAGMWVGEGAGMRDGGAVGDAMWGGRTGARSVQDAATERTRDVATSGEATWVGGGVGEPGHGDELWGERGFGARYAAVAIAALVGVIGLGLWLGRPGGETNSAAPSSTRSTPTAPGSLVPTESAQAASPNVVIPGIGQPCDPDVDGNAVAVDGTSLACRTVGVGIANWVPVQPFGDGQQADPTVVGNGNPHVDNSANGNSGNDNPNKGKPGHGGRAKPGK
ncbi:serine/threonine-protein kinase [Nocardia anaemiae]|uniref:serine/threonine-protein kinase n=1 Tax=Nocardia anaemiae TaxID=263910 RepID=UPI000A5CCB97|nr:serine/threonine-protein kinase [Nocardia anaemiae]